MRNTPLQWPITESVSVTDSLSPKPKSLIPAPALGTGISADPRDFNQILYGGEVGTLDTLGPVGVDGPFVPPYMDRQATAVPAYQLPRLREEWIQAGGRSQQSPRTLIQKRVYSDKLFWFIHTQGATEVGLPELEGFFDHLTWGHLEPNGRFGNRETDPRSTKELRPVTVVTYHAYLKGFWTYLERRGYIAENPFRILEKPVGQSDQIQPFTQDQFMAMIRACKNSACPQRNEALLLFFLDTGLRTSETAEIKLSQIDFSMEETLRVRVLGKGNKYRTIRLSRAATQAMWSYFKTEHGLERFYKNRTASRRRKVEGNTPLFISAHRAHIGEHLTRSGLYAIVRDICARASIGAVRCSPHTIRHTFAITFLRNGGNIFTLRDMLGHTNLTMVQRYLAIAQSDVEAQHALYSPADGWMMRR